MVTSSGAFPGPLRRLSRDRIRLAATVLLALSVLSVAGVQSAAAATLQSTLDANWRGAYDILVIPKTSTASIGRLVSPNGLPLGAGGMSLADVEMVRKVAGVGVAAPIGEVVVPGLTGTRAQVLMPKAIASAATPQAYRLTETFTTNDGLGNRLVNQGSFVLVVDGTGKQPVQTPMTSTDCEFDDLKVDTTKYPDLCQFGFTLGPITETTDGSSWGNGDGTDGSNYAIESFDVSPVSNTFITLVDPKAERQLLGSAGTFLKPLESLSESGSKASKVDAWAAAAKDVFAKDFSAAKAKQAAESAGVQSPKQVQELKQLYIDNGRDPSTLDAPPQHYVPVVVSGTGAAPLTLTVTAVKLGDAPSAATDGPVGFPYQLPAGTFTGSVGSPLGSSSGDVGGAINPFIATPSSISWPGTDATPSDSAQHYRSVALAGVGEVVAPAYKVDGSTSVTLTAQGFKAPTFGDGGPGSSFRLSTDGTVPGVESAYSGATDIAQPQNGAAAQFVPIGSLDTSGLATLQSTLGSVPLGAYESVGSTATVDGKSTALNSSVSGLGLVSSRTVAVASIADAAQWHQDKPVRAIRVRVNGIGSYSKSAQDKLLSVANSIKQLGFTAIIVAGSSPTQVNVQVDDYAFGVTDPSDKQKVGPLGEISQNWSQLGAAAQADVAVSGASIAVAAIALAATAILMITVQLASLPRRRLIAHSLREIGWTRPGVRRWLLAEDWPIVVLVAVAGFVSILLSGESRLSEIAAGTGLVALIVSATVVTVVATHLRRRSTVRPVSKGRRRLKLRFRSAVAVGIRFVGANLSPSIGMFVATVVVGIAAPALVVVVTSGVAQAGASLLATTVAAQGLIAQTVLGVVAVSAGILMGALARAAELARRASQWSAMHAMGWAASDLRAVQRTEALVVAIPAVIAAAAIVWFAAPHLTEVDRVFLLAVSLAATVMMSVILQAIHRRAKSA